MAQLLEPAVKLGKNGVTAAFLAGLNEELTLRELVKIKLGDFKDQRQELATQMAEATHSALVQVVGHVVVLYRPRPKEEAAGRK